MKTIILNTLLLFTFTAALAQQKEKRLLGNFYGIEVKNGASVTLVQSDTNAITYDHKTGTTNLMFMSIDNGRLTISGPLKGMSHITVYAKNLNAITVGDGSSLTGGGTLNFEKLNVQVTNGSNAGLDVHCKLLEASARDAAYLKLTGNADSTDLNAEDAANIKASELRSGNAYVNAGNGSDVSVNAQKYLEANASDGSSIRVFGSPRQKVLSTGGSNIETESGDIGDIGGNQEFNDNEEPDSSSGAQHFNHHFGDGFIGGGFVTGKSQQGATVLYGTSREFVLGIGGGYKLFKWNGIGADLYYKATDFYLSQDSMNRNTITNTGRHQAEKLAFNNFGGLVYDRFFIGNLFFDGGFYYEWTFHTRNVMWDNNIAGASSVVTIERNLDNANAGNYGLTFRIGTGNGFCFYFTYRLSNLINSPYNGITYPQLPQYVVGITFGGFDAGSGKTQYKGKE